MSKILIACVAFAALIIVATVTRPALVLPAGAYNVPTKDQMEINRKAYALAAQQQEAEWQLATTRTLVTAMLREPASGKFGVVFHGRGKAVCGTINARNGFGGMTGQKAFVRLSGKMPMFEDAWNESFVNAWNRHCANV